MARRICVFCGSSTGSDPRYPEAAASVGRILAQRGIELVYGGATRGLMGIVADHALAAGGHVIGIIPDAMLNREIEHRGIQDLRIVHA
jgi:uncharacterized protein (TIGR00730 family)